MISKAERQHIVQLNQLNVVPLYTHTHEWMTEATVGQHKCRVCGLVVTFDHRETDMGSIEDWAAKCARRVNQEYPSCKMPHPSDERIAAIIATFTEPLMQLLRESRRGHHHSADGDIRDGTCCPQCCCQSWPDDPEGDFEPTPNSDKPCDCGADAWNARVDDVLDGVSK